MLKKACGITSVVLLFMACNVGSVFGEDDFEQWLARQSIKRGERVRETSRKPDGSTLSKGATLMHIAAADGRLDVIEKLKERNDDTNTRDEIGRIPLYYAAEHGKLEIVKWFKEQGVDITVKDRFNMTAMHWAAERGQLEVMKWLKEQGADINAKCTLNNTPFDIAKANGQNEVIDWLFMNGVDTIADDNADAWLARQPIKMNERIQGLSRTASGTMLLESSTLMHIAVADGRVDVMEKLKKQGADLNVKDMYGRTLQSVAIDSRSNNRDKMLQWLQSGQQTIDALIKAVKDGDIEAMENLKEQGIDVNEKAIDGMASMHHAAIAGQLEAMKWLKKHGADVNIKSSNNRTPLYLAIINSHEEVTKWLVENGGKE